MLPAPLVSGSETRCLEVTAAPSNAQVKGNQGSNGWIYTSRGTKYYGVTNPEECSVTAADAGAAG